MMQRLSAKLRAWGEALAGIDDPLGEYLLSLDERVRRLERDIQQLSKRPSVNATAAGATKTTLAGE